MKKIYLDKDNVSHGTLTNRKSLKELKGLFNAFDLGFITKEDLLDNLGIKERRYYQLLALYRKNKLHTIYKNKRGKNKKIGTIITGRVIDELEIQRRMILDDTVDIKRYNYTYITEKLKKKYQIVISPTTVSRIAHKHEYHLKTKRPKKDLHTRKVLTKRVGELLQHDSSEHMFAPLANEKWYLIATIDDYSRFIVYAKLFKKDRTWNHMLAVKHVALSYGIGCTYYTDNHSIFRFIYGRDTSNQDMAIKSANQIKTQWGYMLKRLGMHHIAAGSSSAKGKIERPFRWIQDRLVRECYRNKVTSIKQAQELLDNLINEYNCKKVHSVTNEIPEARFNNALKKGKSVFTALTKEERSSRYLDKIIKITISRKTDGYGILRVLDDDVEANLLPDTVYLINIIPDSIRPRVTVLSSDGEILLTSTLKPDTHGRLKDLTAGLDMSSIRKK